jgi:hypothetical protein
MSVSNWLKNTRAVSERYQDPSLSALMVAQVILIFVAEPLAFEGFEPPLVAIGIIVGGLILLLVLGSYQHGALIIVLVHRFGESDHVGGIHFCGHGL